MIEKIEAIELKLIDLINDIINAEKYSPDYKARLLSDANTALQVVRILKAKVEL